MKALVAQLFQTTHALILMLLVFHGGGATAAPSPKDALAKLQPNADRPVIDIDAVLKEYRAWWYNASPFPKPEMRAALRAAYDGGSRDPEVMFWLSRDMRRAMVLEAIDDPAEAKAEREAEVRRLTKEAAEKGLDVASACWGIEEVERDGPDKQAAIRALLEALRREEPEALLQYGRLYRSGQLGVTPDLEKSEKCLYAAITRGYVRAYTELARTYKAKGDVERAGTAVKRGAEGGDAEAQWLLGKWLRDGVVSRANSADAEQWLRRAAAQDFPQAKYELALLLSDVGGAAEYPEALRLLKESARLIPSAKVALARAYLFGDLGNPVDTAAAGQMFEELAAAGNADANYELGVARLMGLWLPRDVEQATKHLRLAADAGHSDARRLLNLLGKNRETRVVPVK